MRRHQILGIIVVLQLVMWMMVGPAGSALGAAAAPVEKTREARLLSDKPLPIPKGTVAIPLAGGDFETGGKAPAGWDLRNAQIIASADAPQGKAYCRIEAKKGGSFATPAGVGAEPGRPYLLSFWLRSPGEHWSRIAFTSDEHTPTFHDVYSGVTDTGNQWKRVSYYFWLPVPCKTIRFLIEQREDSPKGQSIDVDDFQLRTATDVEMSAAYEAQRALLPAYDRTPRTGDGGNLALSVAKWEGRAGLPGKPFVIWALGSSWTAAQGDGYALMHEIRRRFPNAPPLVYKRHMGAGTEWMYCGGWVKQFVAAEQPDLIFTYTGGPADGLDTLLTEIRRNTTADIIVPSLHLFRDSGFTEREVERVPILWDQAREFCRKHHAEFVEHRREMAEYLQRVGLKPDDLLWDHVHQSLHGRTRVWDDVARHINHPDQFTYAPELLERRIPVAPPAKTAAEQVVLKGKWTSAKGVARTREQGARLEVQFNGNTLDLIGRKTPGGGTVKVTIDGQPVEQAPVFLASFIEAHPVNRTRAPEMKWRGNDCAPHAVDLGKNVVPQAWTITVTSDTGGLSSRGEHHRGGRRGVMSPNPSSAARARSVSTRNSGASRDSGIRWSRPSMEPSRVTSSRSTSPTCPAAG